MSKECYHALVLAGGCSSIIPGAGLVKVKQTVEKIKKEGFVEYL